MYGRGVWMRHCYTLRPLYVLLFLGFADTWVWIIFLFVFLKTNGIMEVSGSGLQLVLIWN